MLAHDGSCPPHAVEIKQLIGYNAYPATFDFFIDNEKPFDFTYENHQNPNSPHWLFYVHELRDDQPQPKSQPTSHGAYYDRMACTCHTKTKNSPQTHKFGIFHRKHPTPKKSMWMSIPLIILHLIAANTIAAHMAITIAEVAVHTEAAYAEEVVAHPVATIADVSIVHVKRPLLASSGLLLFGRRSRIIEK